MGNLSLGFAETVVLAVVTEVFDGVVRVLGWVVSAVGGLDTGGESDSCDSSLHN